MADFYIFEVDNFGFKTKLRTFLSELLWQFSGGAGLRSKEDADLSIINFLNNFGFLLLNSGWGFFLFGGGVGVFSEEVYDKQEES